MPESYREMWYNYQRDCWGIQHEYRSINSVTYKGVVYQCVITYDYIGDWVPVEQGPAPLEWEQKSDFGYLSDFLEVRSINCDPQQEECRNTRW